MLSAPLLPDTAAAMLRAVGLETADWPEDVGAALGALPAGHPFEVPEVLFVKLDDGRREDLATQFSGA